MLERLKRILGFVIHHPKDAAIIGLSLICIFLNWQIGIERKQAQRTLATKESLPEGTKQIITVYRDRVITKWRDGPERIIYKERYLPPEGRVELVTKEVVSSQPPEIRIKDRGFASRLGGGMVYSDGLLPQADLKWFYLGRYSTLLVITSQFGGLGLSRHIDDFTPFQNLEFVGDVGLSWQGNARWGLGLRTNF